MTKKPSRREAPISDGRDLLADELTDTDGRKFRDLDRVGAMTPDTDADKPAKRPDPDVPSDKPR